jgi:hypothetical protein
VGQGSLLSGCQIRQRKMLDTHRQEERARSIYQRALKAQGRARARAVPKSKKLNPTLGVSFLNTLALDHDKPQFLNTDASGLQPPDIDHQPPADSHHGFFL